MSDYKLSKKLSKLYLITLTSLFCFNAYAESLSQTPARGYPYGCTSASYVEKVGDWKFRCYTNCACEGSTNKYIPGNLTEEECLEEAIKVPQSKGANIGSGKCQIIINKCIDFKDDKTGKAPYCSKYKGY